MARRDTLARAAPEGRAGEVASPRPPKSYSSTSTLPDWIRRVRRVLEHILLARRASGAVVFLVTHDLPRGLRLADRVLVLRRGRVAFDGEAVEDGAAELLKHFTTAPRGPS